jgi:hypothetical protein
MDSDTINDDTLGELTINIHSLEIGEEYEGDPMPFAHDS